MLQVEDLKVHFDVFGGRLKVLDGVFLSVAPGEKVGLVGEAGCGKTTTVKTVMGVLPRPPARIAGGRVLLEGQDLLRMGGSDAWRLRKGAAAMIFQDPAAALNPVLTVGQQLADVISYADRAGRRPSKEEVRGRAIQALKDVALPDPERLLASYPFQLSGGMRQRVCIAMALVTARKLLIADEPGTALDVTIQAQILRLLRELVERRGISILLITHSLGVVREWTDRVYVMYAGSIVESAPTSELFARPLHPYTQALMNAVPRLSGGGIPEGIEGRIPDYLDPPEGCRFHPRCPFAMARCRLERPPAYRVDGTHQVACFLHER